MPEKWTVPPHEMIDREAYLYLVARTMEEQERNDELARETEAKIRESEAKLDEMTALVDELLAQLVAREVVREVADILCRDEDEL